MRSRRAEIGDVDAPGSASTSRAGKTRCAACAKLTRSTYVKLDRVEIALQACNLEQLLDQAAQAVDTLAHDRAARRAGNSSPAVTRLR